MMNAMFQSRADAQGAVRTAAEKLLPSLSQSQQGQARMKLPGLMAAGRGPGMGGGMGHGMGQGMGAGAAPPRTP